jgi:hypothetical protein
MKTIHLIYLAVLALPTVLRDSLLVAILRAALTPLQRQHDAVHALHMAEPTGVRYRLKHNGQVCYLQAALNDHFDPQQRRIRIGGNDNQTRQYLYYVEETVGTAYVNPVLDEGDDLYLYPESDYYGGESETDFTVWVPSDVGDTLALRAVINYYKMLSVTYEVRLLA